MGGNQSSEGSLPPLQEEEKRALHQTFPLLRTADGFAAQFQLKRLPTTAGQVAHELLRTFHPASSVPDSVTSLSSLESVGHLAQLYARAIKSSNPAQRVHFYWRIFPSWETFFCAAHSLAQPLIMDESSEEEREQIVQCMIRWVKAEEESAFSSHLIGLEGAERDGTLLQLFLDARVPRLIQYFDQWLYKALTGLTKAIGQVILPTPSHRPLPASVLWLLSMALPMQLQYITEQEIISQQSKRRTKMIDLFAEEMAPNVEWDLVYSANRDGSSMKRLEEAVYGYPAASLVLVEDSEGGVFGGFNPDAWPRHEKQFFGDERCFLFSASPQLNIYTARGISSNFIRYPDKERRNDPRVGIGFGGKQNHERLWVDGTDNFIRGSKSEMCSTYLPGLLGSQGDEFEVKQLHIWGFGGAGGLESRQAVRDREDKFTERNKKVDKAAFFAEGQNINENPDKMMMDWMSTKRKQ